MSLVPTPNDHPPAVSNITLPIDLTKPVQVELKANDPLCVYVVNPLEGGSRLRESKFNGNSWLGYNNYLRHYLL